MHNRILRTAFFTALFSYLGFGLIEYIEPGFTSFVFSVHLIGLLALVLGVAWMHSSSLAVHSSSLASLITSLAIGIVLAIVVWREGEVFGDFRLLLALGCFVLPWFTRRFLLEEN